MLTFFDLCKTLATVSTVLSGCAADSTSGIQQSPAAAITATATPVFRRRMDDNVTIVSEPASLTPATGDLAAFKTASGTWRVRVEGDGWLWTLDENPGWSSAMACNESTGSLMATVSKWTLVIPSYTCRFAQDDAPVKLSSERIRAAVAEGRWVAYDPKIADAWPVKFGDTERGRGSLTILAQTEYDPAGSNGESASSNNVGVISGQGGEYLTSRGAADDPDARAIALALAGENVSIHTDALYVAAFASAGFPNRTPFSGSMLRDPQKPYSGAQYEHRVAGREVSADIESIVPDRDWLYDTSHLANSGWALWLGTEDPRIGLIVQSHAQFTLAARPEYKRISESTGNHMDAYKCMRGQERGIYNCLNAMWRARDVAQPVQADDVMLWSTKRVEEMYAETTTQIADIVEMVATAPRAATANYANRITGTPFDRSGCAKFTRADGSTFYAVGKSNFQDQQYGGVPSYLRARAGEPLGKTLVETQARHMIGRMLYIGGAAGVDGRHDVRGSTFPLAPCIASGSRQVPDLPSFSDTRGWATWVESQNIVTTRGVDASTESMADSGGHTAVQIGFILRGARELASRGNITAPEDLEPAIAAFEAARDATPAGTMRFPIWHKHVAAPISSVVTPLETSSVKGGECLVQSMAGG